MRLLWWKKEVWNHQISIRFYLSKREKIESNQIRGIFIGKKFVLYLCDLLFAHLSECLYAEVFQEICTQYPIHSFCHREIYLFDIPATFSILFSFLLYICFAMLIFFFVFNWVGSVVCMCICTMYIYVCVVGCYRSLFSHSECLILLNYSFIFIEFCLWNTAIRRFDYIAIVTLFVRFTSTNIESLFHFVDWILMLFELGWWQGNMG